MTDEVEGLILFLLRARVRDLEQLSSEQGRLLDSLSKRVMLLERGSQRQSNTPEGK